MIGREWNIRSINDFDLVSKCSSVVDHVVQVRRYVEVQVLVEREQVLVVILHLVVGHVGRVDKVAVGLDSGVNSHQRIG